MSTIIVFMLGMSWVLTAAVGVVAYVAILETRLVRNEAVKARECMLAVLAELQRIKSLAEPIKQDNDISAASFSNMIGLALVKQYGKAA